MSPLSSVLRVFFVGFALIIVTTLVMISSVVYMLVGTVREDDHMIGASIPPTCTSSGLALIFVAGTMGLCKSHAIRRERRRKIISGSTDSNPAIQEVQKLIVTKWLGIILNIFRVTWIVTTLSYFGLCKWLQWWTAVSKHIVFVAPYFGIPMFIATIFVWFFGRSTVSSIKVVAGRASNQFHDD